MITQRQDTFAAFTHPMGCRAYRFAGFMLDLDQGLLRAPDGAERPLRRKSFALLQLLAENAGRVVSQQTILDTVWPGIFINDNGISQCIREIRCALAPEGKTLLRTLSRRGFLFTAEVTRGHPHVSEILHPDFNGLSGHRGAEMISTGQRQGTVLPFGTRQTGRPAA